MDAAGIVNEGARRLSPALVGLSHKSRWNDLDRGRAIDRALDMSRGSTSLLPVFAGPRNEVLGHVRARSYWDNGAEFWPIDGPMTAEEYVATGYTKFDDIISANSVSGRHLPQPWYKNFGTAPVANNWYDLWPVSGSPQAGTYSAAAFTARSITDADTGAMYKAGNVESTYTMHALYCWALHSGTTPSLMAYDRVLTYEACITTTTTSQNMTNTATAARYNGTGLSGMQIVVTCQTATGSTATTLQTLTYTNNFGTGSQTVATGTAINLIVSAAAPTATLGARVIAPATSGQTVPWGWHLPLATTDGGVRAIANYKLGTASSGTLCFVLARPYAITIPCGTAGIASVVDLVQQTSGLERLYDGAAISWMTFLPAATTGFYNGDLVYGWN